MGKKRSVKKDGGELDASKKARVLSRIPKKKLKSGILNIESTFNNTKLTFADEKGNVVMWATSGALGFKSAKKATPYASAKVSELIADKAQAIGVTDVNIIVKGVGPGRESALRTFVNKGFLITSIKDKTPVPHNGPRKPKKRRV